MKGDETLNGPPPSVVPLRTILQNFLNLVENYEARRHGGLDSYDSEFQELKQFSENLKSDANYSCKEGEKSVNRKKNRYKDILPFDYSRVKLSDHDDIPGSDYINASLIKGASGSAAYIAAQGPLPGTLNSFWQCVWEQKVQVIVMACNEQESGKHKCENYWVDEDGVERDFGQVTVWLKKCRQICPDFLIRTMRIRYTDPITGETEERNVCQFHYSAWPDHSVPTRVRPLLDMVRLIRDCQTSETLPVLVHCSAGCGRTGTICAIDQIWGLLRLGRLTPDFSLFNLVKEMRRQRIAMVQTKDQYILVHRAVKELFQEQLKIIDSHPYANVDGNGLPIDMKKELEEPTYETLEFSSENKNRGLLPLPPPPPPPSSSPPIAMTIAKAEADDIIVSVSNINTNGISSSCSSSLRSSSLSPSLIPTPVPLPCRGKSSSSKLEKEVENYQKHQKEQEKIRGKSSSSKSKNNGSESKQKSHNNVQVDEEKEKIEKDREKKSPSSDTEVSDRDRKQNSATSTSTSTSSSSTSSSSNANTIRSALMRKPSIVKLKSFFEKMSKEEKERKPNSSGGNSGSTLSRTKSDLSTRFYSFNNPFTSRTPPSTLTTTKTSKQDTGPTTSSTTSSSQDSKTANATLGKGEKPQKPPKPNLAIKRSKSLKASLVPDSVKFSAFNLGKHRGESSTKQQQKSDLSNSNSNSNSSSMGGLSTSSSSGGGFSLVTDPDNAIKVNVKQVEMPKLQAIVSKSVKPPVQNATTTNANQEYDYDIDDRSHLRRENAATTSASGGSKSKSKPVESDNSLLNLMGQSSSSSSSAARGENTESETHHPGYHILNNNHNYVNLTYNRNNNSSKKLSGSSSSNDNNQNTSSSNSRNKMGMAREMEDLIGVHNNIEQLQRAGDAARGGRYDKLKKCDTVNPRLIAATLGFSRKNERTSLTRSQSHVWQLDKSPVPVPVRIFSNDNLYQSSPPSKAGDYSIHNNHRRTPSLEKSCTPPYNTANDGFIIQAIHADISAKPLGKKNSTDISVYENIRSGPNMEKTGVTASSSSIDTTKTNNNNPFTANTPMEKPVIRRRVPKTNPYANYPACVTGSNSKFPFQSPGNSGKESATPPPPLADDTFQHLNHNYKNHNDNYANANGNNNYATGIYSENISTNNKTNNSNSSDLYSNSILPSLKATRGSEGSVGNSSSDSNVGTPRNSSLPSTPTQSVDVLYPPLLRPHSNESTTQYPTKSILKEPLASTSSESDERLDSSPSSRAFSNIPNSNSTTNNNNNHNNNSSSSTVPKINTIRIAVGVRERRNSFRQAVWKESNSPPNNGNNNNNNSNGDSITTPSSKQPLPSINEPQPPRAHKNYEPIWPESQSGSGTYPNSNNGFNKTRHLPSYSTAIMRNETRPLDHQKLHHQPGLPPPLQPQPIGHHYNNSNTNPNPNKPLVNNNAFRSFQDDPQNREKTETNSSNNNNNNGNAAQAKIDEIKKMLAELNSTGNSGNIKNSSSIIYGKTNHNSSSGSSSSLKQHSKSLRAPSRSEYQQQQQNNQQQQHHQSGGLSCFTFRKPTSLESIVDQIQADDDDEYPLLTRSTRIPQPSKIMMQEQHQQQQQLQHYSNSNARNSGGQHYDVLRNISSSLGRGGMIEGDGGSATRPGNDYVVLRQCKTYENSNSNSHQQQQLQLQKPSSSSTDFPVKFNTGSDYHNSISGSSLDSTPIPPPRLRRHHNSNMNTSTNNTHHHNNYHHLKDTTENHHQQQPQLLKSPQYVNRSMNSSDKNSLGNNSMHQSQHNNSITSSTPSYNRYDNMNYHHQDRAPEIPQHQQSSSSSSTTTNNTNNNTSLSSTSPKTIIRALGLFSKFANWADTKDKDRSNVNNSNSVKRSYENGIESLSTEQDIDGGDGEPGKSGLHPKASIGNLSSSGQAVPLLTKHQYL